MTTLKQSLAIDGQAISNLDPELVITLDAHPSVQISNKTESTITYSFIGNVTKDATYTLNLTFVYKGIHKLVMPLTFEQTVNDPVLRVTNIPKSVKIWDEGSDVPFNVFYGPEPGEDITESISDVVITPNTYVESKGGSNWRIKSASQTAVVNNDTDYAFNVTHGSDKFAIKAKAAFAIAQWNGVEFTVTPITSPLECTMGVDTVVYFKPTWQGKYEKGVRINPIDGTNRHGITIVKQEDDDENERLVVTIRGATIGKRFYNQFIFQRAGSGSYSSVQWLYVDVYAKAITATTSPARTDTKLGDIFKLDITNIRIGHEKVDLLDPRVTFSSSSNNNFSRLSVEKDKAWFLNNNDGGFVNVSIYIDVPGYTQFSKVVPMYTIAGTVTGNTLNVKDPSENLPAQHNVQTFTLVDGLVSLNNPAPVGLKLIGKLDTVMNGNKPVLKLYNDFTLTDTPVTGSASFSMDNGHSGNNITLGGLFEDATGKQWALSNAVFRIPQSPMLMTTVVPGPIDVPNTDQQVINMRVDQLQFDKQTVQLTDVLFGGMSISGEASAIGTITKKGDGTYLVPITPTGNSGNAVIKGYITYEGVGYAFTSTITFKEVADIKVTSKPLNVKVFDTGSELPFTVSVDGVDKTSELTNVQFTPTTNVIAHDDGWEIWDAPNAGVTEKIKYTFDIPTADGPLGKEFTGDFVIGAWDGKMFKVDIGEGLISGSTAQQTVYVITPMYRGKPAADKVEVMDLGPTIRSFIEVVESVPINDNKDLSITLRVSNNSNSNIVKANAQAAPLAITGLKYRLKGTPGLTEDKDVVTIDRSLGFFHGNYLSLWGSPWIVRGPQGSIRPIATSGGATSVLYVFRNGVRIPLDNENLYVYTTDNGITPGAPNSKATAFEYVYGKGTALYLKITRAQISPGTDKDPGYYNPIRLGMRDGGAWVPSDTSSNFWIKPSSGIINNTVTNGAVIAEPSKDNTLLFQLANGGRTLTAPQLDTYKVLSVPTNGNALIKDLDYSLVSDTTDKSKLVFKFAAGHTGDSVRIQGAVRDVVIGDTSYLDATITVPKSPVTIVPEKDTYTAKADVPVDVVFDMNMMYYNQVEADLSQIVFKTISVTGNANGTTLPVNVSGNKFKTPITIPNLSGTASITGTFSEKDAPTIEYGFAMTFPTTQDAVITTSPAKLNVKVWDVGTKVPFVVKADGNDITDQIVVIGFTPTTHVVRRTVGTNEAEYLITSDAVFGGVTETVNYKYRLPSDAADVVREASGDFVIGAYDGIEFKAYVDSGSIWHDGVFFVFQNTSGNQAEKLYVKGKYKGEEVNISHVDVSPNAQSTGPLRMTLSSAASGTTLTYNGVAYAGTGAAMITIAVRVTFQPGNTEGIDLCTFKVPCSVYNNSNYVIVDKNTTLTGKKGQEMEVYCKIAVGRTVVKLDNPEHKVVSNKGNVEFIPGSMTPFGFKVRFTDDVEATVNSNVQLTISNASSSVVGTWNTVHLPSMEALELSADFVTAIEGDSGNTVTVKQSTILPTE